MTDNQRIRRARHDKENPFAQISREMLQDKTLSYEARGLVSYLLSKSGDWEIRLNDLQIEGTGRDKVYRILHELQKAGYVSPRQKFQDEKGYWQWTPYEVFETPNLNPLPENPYTDHPYTENTEIKEQTREDVTQRTKEKERTTFASTSTQARASHIQSGDGSQDDHRSGDEPFAVEGENGQPINATTTTPPSKVAPKVSPVRAITKLEREIMKEISVAGKARVEPTTENMNCAAKLCDDGFMLCEKFNGRAFYSLTEQGKTTLEKPLTYQQILVKVLGDAFGVPAVGKDGGKYAKVANDLITATIPTEEFKQYVGWVRREAKKSGDWKVTIMSLSEKGRPSEYVAARNAHNARTGVSMGASVGSMLDAPKNVYNPHLDPAYARQSADLQ